VLVTAGVLGRFGVLCDSRCDFGGLAPPCWVTLSSGQKPWLIVFCRRRQHRHPQSIDFLVEGVVMLLL
jgi:hypothetical protein